MEAWIQWFTAQFLYENTTLSKVAAFLAGAIVCFFLKHSWKARRSLPPGPFELPFVGYLPFMGTKPHLTFIRLKKKYGNVIGFHLGKFYTVVLDDFAAVKEGLLKDEFLGRSEDRNVLADALHDPCIVKANGIVWREQKRFALHHLKNLGYGKGKMEQLMREEISCFVDEILEHEGKPFDFSRLLLKSAANNILIFVAGHQMDYKDTSGFATAADFVKELANNAMMLSFAYTLPDWMRTLVDIFGGRSRAKTLQESSQKLRTIICHSVEEHKKTFDASNIRDYIDAFLFEMSRRDSSEKSSFTEEFLIGNVEMYLAAGTETVSTTIMWIIHMLAVHQDVQERAYNEVMAVIGRDRMPTWADHLKMPFCQAVIAEVLRLQTITPLGLERTCLEDTSFQGFDIPKGTKIIFNLWAVHHDPTYWKDPDTFDPTRFLNEDRTVFIKNERLIPFEIGKRSCVGEHMANVETFLYFASLLQRVKFKPREGKTISLVGVFSTTYEPISMDSIRLVPRKRYVHLENN